MKIEFDPLKNRKNIQARQLSFERAVDFDFESSLTYLDTRMDYGEDRWVSIGFLDDRLHVICYLKLLQGIRVISLRKANERERRVYDQAKAPHQ